MLVREWRFPLSFPGTIIDIETTEKEATAGELITFGFFSAEAIRVYQRIDSSKKGRAEFDSLVRSAFNFLPRPYYAFHAEFETSWLGIKFDHDLFKKWSSFADRHKKCEKHGWKLVKPEEWNCPSCNQPFRSRLKWPKLSELVSMPHAYYGTEIEATGEEIPLVWNEFRKTGEQALLLKIIYHNVYDLIRSACLILWDETILDLMSDILKLEKVKPRTLREEAENK